MRRPNAWHQAIVSHMYAAGEPLPVVQIWQRMEATLGARIAKLVQMKTLARVGSATYRRVQGSSMKLVLADMERIAQCVG